MKVIIQILMTTDMLQQMFPNVIYIWPFMFSSLILLHDERTGKKDYRMIILSMLAAGRDRGCIICMGALAAAL
jgi:hypothetical protein